MTDETVLYETTDGVATITLNRPEKLNAFGGGMLDALPAAVAKAEGDGAVRALLITGAGRGFCAGADLGERSADLEDSTAKPTADVGARLESHYNPLIMKLQAMEMPVIAAVNGVAAGAGASLALACDIVIAARSARFIQAFAKIGLVPDAGSTYTLPRLVGRARALGMAMLGDSVNAEQAAEWGLIWQVVDDDALMDEATTLARRLAAGPTAALGLIKQAFNASSGNSLEAQLDLERQLQRTAGQSEDFREGVTAFLEKRPARFKGR